MSFVDTLRRLSGGAHKPTDSPGGPTSPRTNVWSSTFDPGRNANMRNVGASFYDKPSAENPGDIWQQHLQSEKNNPKAQNNSSPAPGDVDAESLRRMFSSDKVEAALKQADPTGAGKVDYNKFMSLMRQNM